MVSLLNFSERVLRRLHFPKAALRARAMEFWRNGEPEVRLLPLLVDPRRTAVDIGASNGYYSWHLMRLAAKVVACEPNPQSFAALRKAARGLDLRQLALSNEKGRAVLRVPVSRNFAAPGWGTIHAGNDFAEFSPDATQSFTVDVARLDDLELADVGFIKIDVEGHENEVLEGARTLLTRDRPNLLVEVGGEVRGNDPGELCATLRSLGYTTMYLRDGTSLAAIDAVPAGTSAVNIIAIPDASAR